MGTLLKGGTIVTASDMIQADVLIEGEKVTLIGQNLPSKGHEVVSVKGKYLMPGGIDVHTHLDLPFGGTYSNDDFDVGHKARDVIARQQAFQIILVRCHKRGLRSEKRDDTFRAARRGDPQRHTI